MNRRLSATLRQLEEPAFADLPQPETLARLTIDTTGLWPISFRLIQGDDGVELIYKQATYDARTCTVFLGETRCLPLPSDESTRILEAFDRLDLCTTPISNRFGFDGGQWIFEHPAPPGRDARVCVRSCWSPEPGLQQDVLRTLVGHVPDREEAIRWIALNEWPDAQ